MAVVRLIQSSVVMPLLRSIAHSWVKETKRPAGRSTRATSAMLSRIGSHSWMVLTAMAASKD